MNSLKERERERERETRRERWELDQDTLTTFPEAVSMPSSNTRMAINNDTARLK